MENKKEVILAIATVAVLIGAGGCYMLWQRSNDSGAQRFVIDDQSTRLRPGPVAVLGQQPVMNNAPAPSDVQGDSTQRPATEPAQPPDVSAQEPREPYTLKLPSGWKKSDSKTTADPCSEGQEVQTDTYKKESQTLIVHVNGHPDGCKRTSVADVYLDYDYAQANTGITIKTSQIEQCSKEDNPACPKRDGRVSLYIGNESAENPDELRKNSQTNNTYFFSLVDTSIGANFEQQVKSLAGLVDNISF